MKSTNLVVAFFAMSVINVNGSSVCAHSRSALIAFLVHYILYRRHGGLRKELNVKTPNLDKPEPNRF